MDKQERKTHKTDCPYCVTEEKYPPKLEVGLCVIFALLNILIVK